MQLIDVYLSQASKFYSDRVAKFSQGLKLDFNKKYKNNTFHKNIFRAEFRRLDSQRQQWSGNLLTPSYFPNKLHVFYSRVLFWNQVILLINFSQFPMCSKKKFESLLRGPLLCGGPGALAADALNPALHILLQNKS